MMRVRLAVEVLLVVGAFSFCLAETEHRLQFGHFANYGAHTDVVLGNSGIGSDDTYYADL